MQDLSKLEIKSERLVLQPVDLKYKQEIFENFSTSITRFMLPDPARDIRETEQFIQDSIQKLNQGSEIICVILLKSTHDFLGCCGLHVRGNPLHPETGLWIKETAHGNRYGREAIHALLNWAQANLEYEYIVYPVHKKNISSRKIPESLNGEIIAEICKVTSSGKELDEFIYAIPNPSC